MNFKEWTWKDYLAVLFALVAFGALWQMLTTETGINLAQVLSNQIAHKQLLDPTGHPLADPSAASPNQVAAAYQKYVLPNLQQWAYALGTMLTALSMIYILLVGRENDIDTSAEEQE